MSAIELCLRTSKDGGVYDSERKVEEGLSVDVVLVFEKMVKSRLLLDFSFYRAADDLDTFEVVWGCGGALCSVTEGQLSFEMC